MRRLWKLLAGASWLGVLAAIMISQAHAYTFQRMLIPKQTIELQGGGTADARGRCIDEWRKEPSLTDRFSNIAAGVGSTIVVIPGSSPISLQQAIAENKVEILGGGMETLQFKNLTADPLKIQIIDHVIATQNSADGIGDLQAFIDTMSPAWKREPDFSGQSSQLSEMNSYLLDLGWKQRSLLAGQEWAELTRSQAVIASLSLSPYLQQEMLNCAAIERMARDALGRDGPVIVCLFPDLRAGTDGILYWGLMFSSHGAVPLRLDDGADQITSITMREGNMRSILVVGEAASRFEVRYDALELNLRHAALRQGRQLDDMSAVAATLPPNRIGKRFRIEPQAFSGGGGAGSPPSINSAIASPSGRRPLPITIATQDDDGILVRIRDWLIVARPRVRSTGVTMEVALGAAIATRILENSSDGDSDADRDKLWANTKATVSRGLDRLLTPERRKILLGGSFKDQVFAMEITEFLPQVSPSIQPASVVRDVGQ